ncbi:MAG: hypothetical protein AAFX85_07940 [Pseudomonadota bacterium]
MSDNTARLLLMASALLWIIWGLVHAAAGVIVMGGDTVSGLQGIADAVPPEDLMSTYHPAVGAILNQHAWNLLWGGLVTIAGAVFVWRENRTAIWVTAMVGGLLDVGYFVFIDLGDFGKVVPGRVMTIFSASAIVLSFCVYFLRSPHASGRASA